MINSSNRAQIHQNIFFGLLILIVIGMQFSHFLVSLGIMLLTLNFFAEGYYILKLTRLVQRRTVLLFTGLFILHVIGLLWSTDTAFAAHDIQIKLPILALPIILGVSNKISRKQFEWVLLFFIATSLLSSIIGAVTYFVLSQPGDDYRLMSPFMSHIRLSLMMGVAVFSTFYLSQKSLQWERFKGWFIGIGFWFVIYLFMLRAMSGIVAVLAAGFIVVWIVSSRQKMKYASLVKSLIILTSFLSIGYVYWQVNDFYKITEIDVKTADTHSKGGELYFFNTSTRMVENGNYIYSYIADNELEKTWNTVSKLDFDGSDLKGQSLKSTLIRYLTSKNLRKDTEGVQALTHQDIWAIENGISNERFLNGKSLNTMMYRYIWETHNYISGFNPQGNSLGQRFLFWKIGIQIFKENWVYGVGTGDVQLSFNAQYENQPHQIIEKYRLRAHNQYLTMGITFGLFGLIYFIVALFSGLLVKRNTNSYLFLGAFIILMVSMLDEDTLETQFGVTYAMFFYFLFLYQQPEKEDSVQNKLAN